MGKGALGALAAYWPEDTARYAHVPLKRVGEVTLHSTAATAADRAALISAASSRCADRGRGRIRTRCR